MNNISIQLFHSEQNLSLCLSEENPNVVVHFYIMSIPREVKKNYGHKWQTNRDSTEPIGPTERNVGWHIGRFQT